MNDFIQTVNGLHRQAMEFTDRSLVAKRYGELEKYLHYTRLALEKEAAAADLMVDEDIEPTRSVLHRSAATLAWRCEEYDRARKLIHRALAGNPPAFVEAELQDLLREIDAATANGNLRATDQTTSKTGVLKIAQALDTSECVLITQNDERWIIEVPDDIMNEVLGAYFNREVQVEGKRMKKERLLRRIRLESKEQIRAL